MTAAEFLNRDMGYLKKIYFKNKMEGQRTK